MDTVTRINRKVVDLKLDRLEEQRNLVLKSLADYINQVIAEGRAWADDTSLVSQNWSTFSQVIQVIDTASDFLDREYIGIKDISEGVIFPEHSGSHETTDLTQPTISSPFGGFEIGLSSAIAINHSAADGPPLQPVVTRCDLMEQSIGSLQSSTEKLKDAQEDMTRQFENVCMKQIDLDIILSDVVSKQTMFENMQSVQVSEDQQQIKKLTGEQIEIMKQQELKIQNLETQLEIVTSKVRELEEMNSSRTAASDDIKSSIYMINVHLELLKSQTESLSSTIDDTSLTVWNLSNKTEAVEKLAQDLSQKVSSNKQALQKISTSQEKLAETVKKLEDLSREAVNRKDLEAVEKQIKEVEETYKMLCVMLSKRLQPLEQLRKCLNRKVQASDEHATKNYGDKSVVSK